MKRYVITSAQYGAILNEEIYKTLKNVCKIKKATLIILPIKYGNISNKYLPKEIRQKVLYTNLSLNNSISINTLPINPANINPLTGLMRFGNRKSQIFASPKIAMQPVATSNGNKLPKVIMTTGSITYPDYSDTRRGKIAEKDHKFGAVLIEIIDKENYNFRQLIANDKMEVNDITSKGPMRYGPDSVKKSKVAGLILKDWHTGETDPIVREITLNTIIPLLKPDTIFLHDLMNSESSNHHKDKRMISKVMRHKNNRDKIEPELRAVIEELKVFSKTCAKKVVVVASNHDEFLERYLQEGRFIKDPVNYEISLELSLAMIRRELSPLEYYAKEVIKINTRKIKFLKRDDDYKVCGIQCANHGDVGIHGARGSTRSEEITANSSVIGHAHTPSINREIWVVGTGTPLRIEYNRGGSGWMQSDVIIFDDGTRQMLNIINGELNL